MSNKRNKNARRGRKMSSQQREKQQQMREQTGRGSGNSVQDARQRAMSTSPERATGTQGAAEEVRPGLFPPSRRPPRDPNRKPWEVYACMIMAVLIVFLVPDWRDPENPWPAWFYVAPLAFGVLGALFALLDKKWRLAWTSAGLGLVLFVGLVSVIALTGPA
ncbi:MULTISPECIES: hypothetical protein [Kocuria]|uniref:Uncharacterized protein n=1 Tax=Kocuria subflava TaxID=1736139 RepID=A0A846TST7_9MICC|nr:MULTISPECIES: hypothetical protein [Kocuria]NKE10040.1 hypothetical protein [Kocuria subflava]